jgi:hypothetical protein
MNMEGEIKNVTLIGAGFITAAMINRSLGPSLRGVYAEMQTWMGLFAVLFGISMDTAIYHLPIKLFTEMMIDQDL